MKTAVAVVMVLALGALAWAWRRRAEGARRKPHPGLSPIQEEQGAPPTDWRQSSPAAGPWPP